MKRASLLSTLLATSIIMLVVNANAFAATKCNPVVVGGYLLGGSTNKKWQSAEKIKSSITGKESYKLYSFSGYLGKATGSKITYPFGEEMDYGHQIKIKSKIKVSNAIAIDCSWDAMPRTPLKQANNNKTYMNIVKSVLSDNGLKNAKVNILQNYKIDLEGDGVDEVVIYAESASSNDKNSSENWRYTTNKGDYSLLLLRKIIKGKVKNIVLFKDLHLKASSSEDMNDRIRYVYGITGFADLNGDGKMEIIASDSYYEGNGYDVFEVNGDKVEIVIENGFGL